MNQIVKSISLLPPYNTFQQQYFDLYNHLASFLVKQNLLEFVTANHVSFFKQVFKTQWQTFTNDRKYGRQ